MSIHYITPDPVSIDQIEKLISEKKQIGLSNKSVVLVEKCYNYLHKKLNAADAPIYGINTGFGSLCNTRINRDDLSQLQENLVKSHACGAGDEVDEDIVKIMMLLKIHALSLGHSGVTLATIQRLIELYNHNVIPVVYQLGSLGASGDLAPLAHLSLPLIGMGEVNYHGQRRYAADVLRELNLSPLRLDAKEGLALLNGTQFMSAHGVMALIRMKRLSALCDVAGAASLDAYSGLQDPFHSLIQVIRPHKGQMLTASNVRHLLSGSALQSVKKEQVQDPYSFRCIPQVHGASKDQLRYVASVVETEINSVTDNPTIFPDEDLIISGGNFHGQPLAIAFDLTAIAASELASISERRVYKLISGQRNLPPFLAAEAGLNSGFMIPQYSAASMVSQNKQLCTPSSVDTIDSSNGQEDHVSMGANAATKMIRVIDNLERVLSIEFMNASQALSFRSPVKSSAVLENLISDFRNDVPVQHADLLMQEQMLKALHHLRKMKIPEGIEAW